MARLIDRSTSGAPYKGGTAIIPNSASYGTNGITSTTTAPPNNSLRAVPVYFANNVTLDRFGAEVTSAGDVGSTVRLGVYKSDINGMPSTLLAEFGSIAGDAVAVAELTIDQTLPAGTYWFASCVQGAATTQPTLRATVTPSPSTIAGSAANAAASQMTGLIYPGQSGAMPATWTSTIAVMGAATRMFWRYA